MYASAVTAFVHIILTFDLKNLFSNLLSCVNISGKFDHNLFTKYRAIALHEIGGWMHRQKRTTDGQTTQKYAYVYSSCGQ